VNEVRGNDFVARVFEDALQVGLGSLLHGFADFLVGSGFDSLHGQIDNRDGRRRHAEGHAGELAFDFGAHEGGGLRSAGAGGNDIDGSGAATLPILLRRTIDGFLRRGVGVDGRHEAFLNAETFLEENVNDRREAVRRAGSVGNDIVLLEVEFVVVNAHNDRDVFALRRSGDDDFLGASGDMALGFFSVGEETGRFDDQLNTQLGPGELSGRFGGNHEDFLAVNDEDIVFNFVGGGFFGADRAVETTLCGVVLQQIGQIVGRDDIADCDDVESCAEKALLHESAENEAADATESIDCDFNCHGELQFLL